MEGLRPERDELDRFQTRNTKPKQKKETVARDKKEKPPKQLGSSSSMSPLIIGLLLLMLVLMGLLGWMHVKQAQTVAALTKDLSDASNFVNQSKLVMARFEGELSEAGAELQQTGTAAENKLAFLDAEMRKLWGVAGDRNKKAIDKNAAQIQGVVAKLAGIKAEQEKALKALSVSLDQSVQTMREEFKALNEVAKDVGSLKAMVANVTNEAALTRDSLEGQVDRLSKRVKSLASDGQRSVENTKAIASIDASRQQLNQRIVGLERKLNEIKLEFAASKVQ